MSQQQHFNQVESENDNTNTFDAVIDKHVEDIEQLIKEVGFDTLAENLNNTTTSVKRFYISKEDSTYPSCIKVPCPLCPNTIISGKVRLTAAFMSHIKTHFPKLKYGCPFYASNCCEITDHDERVLSVRKMEEMLLGGHFEFKNPKSLIGGIKKIIPYLQIGKCIPCGKEELTVSDALSLHWNIRGDNEDVDTICPKINAPVGSYAPQDPREVPLIKEFLKEIKQELGILRANSKDSKQHC